MQQQSPSWVRYLVLGWLCLAATIAYVQRNSIGVAESTIRADLGLSEDDMGIVLGAFFATYAIFQIPSGWLADRWGTRRSLAVFVLFFSASCGTLALASGAAVLVFVRLNMGATQAGIFPASTTSIGKWFPTSRWAVANGALSGFMQLGNALGVMITGFLLDKVGVPWRWLFVWYALPGLAWAAWFFVWFRDRPAEHAAVNHAELSLIQSGRPAESHAADAEASHHERTPWGTLLANPAMAWICAQQFCRAAAHMFFASWFATFLQEARGVSLAEAGVLTSLPLWATMAGSLAGGWISDWILAFTGSRRASRQWFSAASVLICAALILASYWVANAWLAVALISAGSCVAAFAGPCSYALTIDMGGKHVASVFSTMNMWGNIGATVFPLVVPLVRKYTGTWDAVLFLFAGIYLVAAVCWLPFNAERSLLDDRGEAPG